MDSEPAAPVQPEAKADRGHDDDGRPRVEIRHKGARLVIRWPKDDTAGEQLPLSFEIHPDVEALEPRVLRRFAPQAELYVAYAQKMLRIWGGSEDDYGTHVDRWESLVAAADLLREEGKTRRGLSRTFYKGIAQEYKRLVEDGVPAPIKLISERHSVTISTASRWIKEARRLDELPAKPQREEEQ